MSETKVLVPQQQLQKVADASVDLVGVAKALYSVATTIDNEELQATLRQGIATILDSSETISSAVKASSLTKR